VEGLASDNPWNPASRDFWGSEPESKANQLFIMAIIGLCISFFGLMFHGKFALFASVDRWPLFHAFILLLSVKMKTRPRFRTLLVLLLVWSAFKIFMSVSGRFYLFGYYWSNSYWLVGFMFALSLAGMTFLVWKQTQKKEHYGPSAKTFLRIVSLILVIRLAYDALFAYEWWSDSGLILLYLGPFLFWVPFSLLYIYRTEIEPWEDASSDGASKDSGISAYAASKLKEAKELLDRGVISEEEFKQIKDDYLK